LLLNSHFQVSSKDAASINDRASKLLLKTPDQQGPFIPLLLFLGLIDTPISGMERAVNMD
jgi:hypothetical protein